MPQFFFSYAKLDKNTYVEQFYTDLCEAVRSKSGIPPKQVGFRDESDIEPGELWGEAIRDALKTCGVFLYLHTPSYFTRPYCGKEWAIAERRYATMQYQSSANGRGPRPFQPILWEPTPSDYPLPSSAFQYSHADYGDMYVKHGLLYIIKIERVEYLRIVDIIAHRVSTAARSCPLPDTGAIPDLAAAVPAFPLNSPIVSVASPANPTKGPKFAQFAFIASRPADLEGIKTDLASHGVEGGDDWRPYPSSSDETVAFIAMAAALQAKLQYEPLQFIDNPDRFRAAIESAMAAGKPVVLIIDIWTLRLPIFRTVMHQFDSLTYYHCTPLIPWDFQDPETERSLVQLTDALIDTFPIKSRDERYSNQLQNIRDIYVFRDRLANILTETKNKIVLTLQPQRQPPPVNLVTDMPIVQGPSGVTLEK